MMNKWQRWDPRIEPKAPMAKVMAYPRWIVEVVPDIFDPANEALTQRVLTKIAKHYRHDRGRFLLRTTHVERALMAFRRLRERQDWRSGPIPN